MLIFIKLSRNFSKILLILIFKDAPITHHIQIVIKNMQLIYLNLTKKILQTCTI